MRLTDNSLYEKGEFEFCYLAFMGKPRVCLFLDLEFYNPFYSDILELESPVCSDTSWIISWHSCSSETSYDYDYFSSSSSQELFLSSVLSEVWLLSSELTD